MRIRSLNLVRFGKFTDQLIDLPRTDPDVHLIVGVNEAGKSTMRDAITDTLFGIHLQTSYGFLHSYPKLEIGACLEDGDRQFRITRYKRNKGSLCDGAGSPLPDDALAAWLGQADRAFFERMFSLDRARLEAGGKEILALHDTVGETLFGSAAGIRGLGAIRQKILDQANAIFSIRKSKDRRFYVAHDTWNTATIAYKNAIGNVRDYKSAREALEQSDQELVNATTALADVEATISRLQRVRRTASAFRQRQKLLKDLESLRGVRLFQADAGSTLNDAEMKVAVEEHSISTLESQLSAAQSKLDALSEDSELVGRKAQIEALAKDRAFVRRHRDDIRHRQTEIATLGEQLKGACAELGWPLSNGDALRRMLPGALVRGRLRHLKGAAPRARRRVTAG